MLLNKKKIVNDLQIFDAINVQNWEKEKVLEIYRKRRSLKCSSLTGLQMVNQEINGPICSKTSRQILLFS